MFLKTTTTVSTIMEQLLWDKLKTFIILEKKVEYFALLCAPPPPSPIQCCVEEHMIFASIAQHFAIGNSWGTNIIRWGGGGGRVTFMYEYTICDNSLKAACNSFLFIDITMLFE